MPAELPTNNTSADSSSSSATRHEDLPDNMEPTSLVGLDELFAGCKVAVRTYTEAEVTGCSGYVIVNQLSPSQKRWRGQVCAVATFPHFTPNGQTQRYTLLLQTSGHVLEYERVKEDPDEPIYEERDGRQLFKAGFRVRVCLPSKPEWSWDSNTHEMEIFAKKNDQHDADLATGNAEHDLALIAIKLAEGVEPPYPTILPDLNNRITGGKKTAFFGIVHRPTDRSWKTFQRHQLNFVSQSIEDEDKLSHETKTEPGDSGAMLYCHAGGKKKLVPVCVVTAPSFDDDSVDENHIYGVNQTGPSALKALWTLATDALEEREKILRADYRRRRFGL